MSVKFTNQGGSDRDGNGGLGLRGNQQLGKNTLRLTMLSALGNLWVARMLGAAGTGASWGAELALQGLKRVLNPCQSDPRNAGCTGNW